MHVRLQGVRRLPAVALLLLAGCVTLPPPPASWPERRSALQGLTGFSLRGRVAVAAGDSGFSAGLRWSQRGDAATVDLTAPLGVGAAHIEQSGDAIAFTTSKGLRLEDGDAKAALQREFGFEPPLESLRYWLLGAGDPALPAEETLDSEQRLERVVQDGWTVDYQDYRPTGGQWLPRRVTLRRESVRIRLLVRDWRLR
jgi:outer membrane lipoprotein LolB